MSDLIAESQRKWRKPFDFIKTFLCVSAPQRWILTYQGTINLIFAITSSTDILAIGPEASPATTSTREPRGFQMSQFVGPKRTIVMRPSAPARWENPESFPTYSPQCDKRAAADMRGKPSA